MDFLLQRPPFSLALAALLDGVISGLVEGFFTMRIYHVTKKLFLALFCWSFSFIRLACHVAIAVLGLLSTEAVFLERWKWLVIASSSVGATGDLIVAAVLSVDLWRKKRSMIVPSRKLIVVLDKLIVSTLQTGILTSMTTFALAIFLLLMDNSLVWIAIFVCLARAFTNSFFASLNARETTHRLSDLSDAVSQPIKFQKTASSKTRSVIVTFNLCPGVAVEGSLQHQDDSQGDLEDLQSVISRLTHERPDLSLHLP